MRVFEFIINPEDDELGMKAISLVDKPAIESKYIAFNKQEKQNFIVFQDEKKYIVAGLALIPDKLIYRVDEETGEDYLGYFSAETIEAIMDKFMKESTMGTLSQVNLQHSDNAVNAHLVESFIIRTPEMLAAVKAQGIENATVGSWYVAYKFDNVEDYEKAISGEFTGFSIEIMLQRELKFNKNYNKNNDKIMTKVKNFIDKFKSLLTEFETGEVQMEEGKIADSDIILRWGEVGQPVLKVAIAEDGTETTEAMPEGEYILESGDLLAVDAMGNLMELRPKAEAPAPLPEEEMQETPAEEKPVETPLAEGEMPPAPEGEMPPAEEVPAPNVGDKKLAEIVDISKDGEYVIKVVVAGGQITEATAEASQNLISEADFSAVKTENDTLKAEVQELQEKLSKLTVKSVFTEYKPKPKTEDIRKMSNLDYQLQRLGISNEKK